MRRPRLGVNGVERGIRQRSTDDLSEIRADGFVVAGNRSARDGEATDATAGVTGNAPAGVFGFVHGYSAMVIIPINVFSDRLDDQPTNASSRSTNLATRSSSVSSNARPMSWAPIGRRGVLASASVQSTGSVIAGKPARLTPTV